jgi:hypothetical protein
MSGILYTATLVTALGCGLVAGAFFAFSTFVMAALRRLKPEEGIAAMQSINILAVNGPRVLLSRRRWYRLLRSGLRLVQARPRRGAYVCVGAHDQNLVTLSDLSDPVLGHQCVRMDFEFV